ncbi:MAG: electron transport complex subunit E [Clostridia bacterium]|nr:electron transport complex subunit E [Clostridia bacterium]
MSKNSKLWIFLKGLIAENPVLVLVLGTCPTLAVTNSVISALCMGVAATIVLVCSNMAISALRKIIPDTVRIPCYIVVIATFVTVVQLVMNAFLPEFYEMMGVYLALIVVNCIILGRAEMYARKNNVLDSALDGLGMGLGFLIALLAMAIIRETLGAGTFLGMEIPFMHVKDEAGKLLYSYTVPMLNNAPGGFLVFGILIAVVNKIGKSRGKKMRKEFSCDGCPSAGLCGKTSCPEMQEITADLANQGIKRAENSVMKEGAEND